MFHDARNVANQVLTIAQQEQHPLTPADLTRIVYLAHAFMLACHHIPLIKQEVEAWQQGPVISDLHQSIKFYGNKPVTQHISLPDETFTPAEQDIILSTWQIHCSLEEPELTSITTAKGTPWHRKWHNTRDKSAVIRDEDIQKFYLGITNHKPPKTDKPGKTPAQAPGQAPTHRSNKNKPHKPPPNNHQEPN